MGLLEKLLSGSKGKVGKNQSALKAKVKEDLKAILYDDELVEELFPIFESLSSHAGFDKVMEILTTKEKQIDAISSGSYFKQESEDFSGDLDGEDEDDEEDSTTDPLVEMINKRLTTK